jgi:hypothetical protein
MSAARTRRVIESSPQAGSLGSEISGSLASGTDVDDLITAWSATLEHTHVEEHPEYGEGDWSEEMVVTVASGYWHTLDFARCMRAGVAPAETLASAYFYDGGQAFAYLFPTGGDLLDGGWDPFKAVQMEDLRLPPEIATTGSYTGLLICDEVSVPEEYQGHKFGLLLQALVIEELEAGARLPVYTPNTFQWQLPAKGPKRKAAEARLRRMGKNFGFRRFKLGTGRNATANHKVTQHAGPVPPKQFSTPIDFSPEIYWMPGGLNTAKHNVARFQKMVEDAGPITIPINQFHKI